MSNKKDEIELVSGYALPEAMHLIFPTQEAAENAQKGRKFMKNYHAMEAKRQKEYPDLLALIKKCEDTEQLRLLQNDVNIFFNARHRLLTKEFY